MFRSTWIIVLLSILLVLASTSYAQELLPLSGDPNAKDWNGRELAKPYKVKPFELQPRPKKEEVKEPIKKDDVKPDDDKIEEDKVDDVVEPLPKDAFWIKGKFFGFEPIPDDQPGLYGFFNGGNVTASIILAEAGFLKFEHPDTPDDLDRNYGFAKLYLQIDIPLLDYWMYQIGIGALTCLTFDTMADSILSNIDTVSDTNHYGWLFMTGTSVLFEISQHVGMILWGQGYYGQAGFTEESYTFFQARGGMKFYIQVTREGKFAIFLGPAVNLISIDYQDVAKTSGILAAEIGLHIADVVMLRIIYGFEDSIEFRFSIGTAF